MSATFRFDNTYFKLPAPFFTRIPPVAVKEPVLVILNKNLAENLNLDFSDYSEQQLADLFSGNHLPEDAEPLAQAYAGHQFGHFTMLGDGRAVVLGEHLAENQERFDVQFKGSGPTPYSRNGDGRAALGPMLREFVISEAMHALNIPTTRSLAVVTTGEPVYRESVLPGAILTRVAKSHVRVGTFQFAALQDDPVLTESLMNYTIERHFPELAAAQNKPLALLDAVMERQVELIVHWMRVGFIHGVMNTDNMALSGETIDYGPCAFMDTYNPETVFSSIDHYGRYAYQNQPAIAQWNLARFAETLIPLIDSNTKIAIEKAEALLHSFKDRYESQWLQMMRGKLGLFGAEQEDAALISDFLDWMRQSELDFTNTFRQLITVRRRGETAFDSADFQAWHARWQQRLERNAESQEASLGLMQRQNPAIIPRNHQVEEALKAASEAGDLRPFHQLLAALAAPYDDDPQFAQYQAPPAPSERVYQTFCGT